MKPPVDEGLFNDFIMQSNIFELTQKMMDQYLENWYKEEPEEFVETMRADFDTVIRPYHFFHEMVSLNKNFNFDPPMDTISCMIRISDAEDLSCTNDRAVFDDNLQAIDDYLVS